MKKTYKMDGLDCANCAAKMEAAIQKIPGITTATVSFMTQRLTLEAEESDLPAIREQVDKAVRKVDPDCRVLWA